MKSFRPIFLMLVLLFLFTNNMSAQKKQIGIDVGFGKTQMDPYDRNTYPYNGSSGFEDYLKIGLGYQYTPKKIFSIKTGLYYENRGNVAHIHYIKVPVGIEFSLDAPTQARNSHLGSAQRSSSAIDKNTGRGESGSIFQFVFGAGLYSGFLISHTGFFSYYDPKKINYGGYGNLGIAFHLFSPKVTLNIGYQQDFDLIPFLVDHERSPGGNSYTDLYRGFDSFLNISMKFMLNKE
jgi:hypothetical protein